MDSYTIHVDSRKCNSVDADGRGSNFTNDLFTPIKLSQHHYECGLVRASFTAKSRSVFGFYPMDNEIEVIVGKTSSIKHQFPQKYHHSVNNFIFMFEKQMKSVGINAKASEVSDGSGAFQTKIINNDDNNLILDPLLAKALGFNELNSFNKGTHVSDGFIDNAKYASIPEDYVFKFESQYPYIRKVFTIEEPRRFNLGALITSINRALKTWAEVAVIEFFLSTNEIEIEANKPDVTINLRGSTLERIFGFTSIELGPLKQINEKDDKGIVTGRVRAQQVLSSFDLSYFGDTRRGFILTDITKNVHYGMRYIPIIGVIDSVANESKYVTVEFPTVQYVPLSVGEFNSVSIHIVDDFMCELAVLNKPSFVTLHIRPKKY